MTDRRLDLFSTGRWTGTYNVLSIDRHIVSRLLPSELFLGPNQLTASEAEHPIYFMVGRQSDVKGTWPIMMGFGVTYNEAMILIPHVRFRDGKRDFNYMPRLYLNSWSPQALGAYVFGYDKRVRSVAAGARSFQVQHLLGGALWGGKFELLDHFDSAEVTKGYDRMARVFVDPLIGFREIGCCRTPLASWMTFSNELRTPAATEIRFDDDLLTGNKFEKSYKFGPMDAEIANRSVHLVSDWTLNYPTSCFDVN